MSKKPSKNVLLLYRILKAIKKGMYPAQIARQLRLSKQLVSYHIKQAEKKGLVKLEFRTNFNSYILTEKGLEFIRKVKKVSIPSTSSSVRLHNLAVKFPILRDNPGAEWDEENELRNWIEGYSRVSFPVGLTVKKTTRSVVVYFHQFRTVRPMFLTEFYSWVLKGIILVQMWLSREKGILIDVMNGEVLRQHVANESPEFNKRVGKRMTVEVKLGRRAESVYPSREDAKAWIDRSLGNVDIETNDMLYEEKLLMMPEYMHQVASTFIPAVEELGKQIRLHLEVLQGIKQAIEELRAIFKQDLAGAKSLPDYLY